MCDKIEILKIVAELADKESDRMWTRYAAMLYACAALGGVVSVAPDSSKIYVLLPCSILGLVVSVVWLRTIPWSLYYQDRWLRDMEAVIESDNVLKTFIQGRTGARLRRPPGLNLRQFYRLVPLSFTIMWCLLGLVSVAIIFKLIP